MTLTPDSSFAHRTMVMLAMTLLSLLAAGASAQRPNPPRS